MMVDYLLIGKLNSHHEDRGLDTYSALFLVMMCLTTMFNEEKMTGN